MSQDGRADLPPLPEEYGRCVECGFDFTAVTVETATATITAAARRYRDVCAEWSGSLTVRPETGGWSPLEYLCHVRDVFATYTIRLYRVRTENCPALEPMLNDLRAARFGYNQLAPSAVLDELEHNAAGLLAEAARVRDWDRVGTRLPGERRTARWLLRQAAHEADHHLGDLAVARQTRNPTPTFHHDNVCSSK